MNIIPDIKTRLDFLAHQRPGTRFTKYYEQCFHINDPLRYIIYLVLGIIFFILALIFAILPGLAVIFWVLCAACIRIPALEKILDCLEARVRAVIKRIRRKGHHA